VTGPRTIGLILAGGRSSRMGGRDKAFVTLAGRPLIAHVVARLAPQVDALAVSSNADPAPFRELGLTVVPDVLSGFRGPLAGIHAGLAAFPHDYLVTAPVDVPLLPRDLVRRLRPHAAPGRCAYASDGEHHTLAILWPPGLAGEVENALLAGRTSAYEWLAARGAAVVIPRDDDSDIALNINTPADLECAERFLARPARPRR
jgi:molybdopterin-guanine dinucleotide biosynthesis protein A